MNINQDGDLEYREWAPNAKEVSLVSNLLLIEYSLVTSTNGIVIHINVRRMISEYGH
jgi:hypothetical protein